MNQWVRDALEHGNLSFPQAAEILTRAGLGEYERSKIQKMTVGRKVTMAEATALSEAIGFPLPGAEVENEFIKKLSLLSEDHRRLVYQLIDSFPAAREADQ